MDFSNLTNNELIRVHEAELQLMKSDIRGHDSMLVALARLVALLAERTQGIAPELTAELKRLLDARGDLHSNRPDGYYR